MYQLERKNFRITDLGNSTIFRKGISINCPAINQLGKLVMYSFSTHCRIFSSQVDIRKKLNFGWTILPRNVPARRADRIY
jgi:hypothetical protein